MTYPQLSAVGDRNVDGTPSVQGSMFLIPSRGPTRDVAVEEPSVASEVSQETLEFLDTPQETQESSQEEQLHPRSGTVPGNTSSDTGHGSGMDVQL